MIASYLDVGYKTAENIFEQQKGKDMKVRRCEVLINDNALDIMWVLASFIKVKKQDNMWKKLKKTDNYDKV